MQPEPTRFPSSRLRSRGAAAPAPAMKSVAPPARPAYRPVRPLPTAPRGMTVASLSPIPREARTRLRSASAPRRKCARTSGTIRATVSKTSARSFAAHSLGVSRPAPASNRRGFAWIPLDGANQLRPLACRISIARIRPHPAAIPFRYGVLPVRATTTVLVVRTA